MVQVVDASHPGHEAQIAAVERILGELGYRSIPRLLVFNKVDLLGEEDIADRGFGRDAVLISAVTGRGVDTLLARIDEMLPGGAHEVA